MTNGEFISSQLAAYGITDADLLLVSEDIKVDDELTSVADAEKAMITLIAKCAMAPYQKSVSEHGLSVSWDMSGISWWYRFLCKKYGITPDETVMEALGQTVIKDRTSKW